MARNRRDLSRVFREILESDQVYFQSPGPNRVEYPCIIYSMEQRQNDHADDIIYKDRNRYTVTLIGRNPDNDYLIDQLVNIRYCSHDRRFISENLYHDVFNLYY